MKTQLNTAFSGPATRKFYFLASCLVAGYFCQAQNKPITSTVFYINVSELYDDCDAGSARLLVEGIDSGNSNYQQLYTYHPGRSTLLMQVTGEFRVTLVGLQCPPVNIYEVNNSGNTSYELNTRPSARLRCYGGRFHMTLR